MQDTLKLSKLLKHDELGIHQSKDQRHRENNKKLWMIEEDPKIVSVENVIKLVLVWLEDLQKLTSYNFHISEILYRDVATNRMQIRLINLRHRHPFEYVVVPN